MKNKIGIICIGQAGGNLGSMLKNEKFDVVFINSSKGDLDTLKTVNENEKYHITDGFGCAKERVIAKKIAQKDFNNINAFLNKSLGEKDFYYIAFSSSGGTGSGISPVLADILTTHLGKKVGLITILPSKNDTLQAHINAYECLQEVSNLKNICSVFFIDNNKNNNISHINKMFANLFSKIFDYKKFETNKGNIDEAEILKLLETKGMISVASCDNKENTAKLIENIKEGVFAPLEDDRKIKYLGLSKGIKFDEDLFTKEIGKYLDKFENTNKEYTLAILSGLTLPFKRVKEMKDKILAEEETILSFEKDKGEELEDIDFLTKKVISKEDNKEKEKLNVNDLFAQYLK